MAESFPTGVQWDHEPPKESRSIVWQIRRTPTGKKAGGLILSHRLVGTHTHFWHGRTRPCNQTSCEACDQGQKPRWHGYLALTDRELKERWITEIPALAADAVDRYFGEHRTLRGAWINLGRVNNKPNGRVVCSLRDSGVAAGLLPEGPTLQPILMRMWEVRECQTSFPTVDELRVHRGLLGQMEDVG